MSDPRVFTDMDQCAAEMVAMFQGATRSLYYSAFVCLLDIPLPGQPPSITMRSLTQDAVDRGVHVHLFFNASTFYGNTEDLDLDPRVRVRHVTGSGTIPAPFRAAFGDTYSNHHQKFLMMDDRLIMVGGVGVHPCRQGWLVLNGETPAYYWHEVGVTVRVNHHMREWVHAQWDSVFLPPPPPLVASTEEHDTILHMVKSARSCIHMEAQLCISTDSTNNRVLESMGKRVARAYHTPGDPFRLILLVNTHQPDEHPIVSGITSAMLHWSRRMLNKCTDMAGVPPVFVKERVFIGTMEHNGVHVKVHSNLIIQDGHTMLRSSSNLTDRSLSKNPCDNEVGVVVSGEAVASTQQRLWRQYLGIENPRELLTPHQAFVRMRESQGVVRPVEFHPGDDFTYTADWVVDGVMRAVHALPFFGGKKCITWKTE
jgi:phosphatidylserine/phosphatidylglycerophosphate/cardiolipin synthase-like enzyme